MKKAVREGAVRKKEAIEAAVRGKSVRGKAVSNSTPLVYLAKLNRLDLLKAAFDEVLIPQEVYDEVVLEGKKLNLPEAIPLERLLGEGFIKVRGVESELVMETLHKGEVKVIQLALESKIGTILVDDKEAVEAGKIFGLFPMRTTALPLRSLKEGLLSLEEFKGTLLDLSANGYFLGAVAYELLIGEAERLKNEAKKTRRR